MTVRRARVADRIVCQGRGSDHRGRPIGGPHLVRAHPGCDLCASDDAEALEEHAAWIATLARSAGWRLGQQDESGRYPHAMCRDCGSPDAGMLRLLDSL